MTISPGPYGLAITVQIPEDGTIGSNFRFHFCVVAFHNVHVMHNITWSLANSKDAL